MKGEPNETSPLRRLGRGLAAGLARLAGGRGRLEQPADPDPGGDRDAYLDAIVDGSLRRPAGRPGRLPTDADARMLRGLRDAIADLDRDTVPDGDTVPEREWLREQRQPPVRDADADADADRTHSAFVGHDLAADSDRTVIYRLDNRFDPPRVSVHRLDDRDWLARLAAGEDWTQALDPLDGGHNER